MALRPDLVVEAAGRAAVTQWALAALAAAPALILASTSAFADDGMLAWLTELAERHHSKIEVPSDAIGGIDALASASILGLGDVLHQIVKPPQAWKATLAERLLDLDNLAHAETFFSGSSREAAAFYRRMPSRRLLPRWLASASIAHGFKWLQIPLRNLTVTGSLREELSARWKSSFKTAR